MESFHPSYHFTVWQRCYLVLKRCFDFFFALVLLILFSPLFLVTALLIKLTSPGPVIFTQRRPGWRQKIFTIYKFRTMRVETMRDGRPLTNEERSTRLGNFLRKSSIDELPQLVNILRGEMSFIGPRPFLINDLGSYNQEQLVRFEVLPGITSWTAVHGRASVSLQDKYNYEIEYVKRLGFCIDAEIFFKTIFLVFSGSDVEDVAVNRIGAEIIDDRGDASNKDN